MTQEQIENNELDKLIRNVLKSSDDLMVPPGLSDKTILKLEKRVLLRELIIELALKIGLVVGSLSLLTGVYIWINGSRVLTILISFIATNWQAITSVFLLLLITLLIDQVGLRFYNAIRKEVSL